PRTTRMLASARRYRERAGGNLFADVLATEQAGARVITRSQHWTAFVPAAARWPVEVHVYPHRHIPDIPALTDAERDDFVGVYLDLLRRFDALYDAPLPYIAAWHQAPVRTGRDLAYLHLQLFSIRRSADKLKYLAGSESGMGAFITDVLPEDVAGRLREVEVR
ncbi:MAG TPA: galactose-1-phosphate uridylyltransferase, partial [Jiangellaceae bacterium]|nr:galactose-1-phosphate uridylyltransferase [Jiangellaceae bacterium]